MGTTAAMKRTWRVPRRTEPGLHHNGAHISHFSCSSLSTAKHWAAALGAAVLLLLLAQGVVWYCVVPVKVTSLSFKVSNHIKDQPSVHVVDVGHLALLDTLWAALPFTRVIKPHQANSSQQKQTAPPHTSSYNASSEHEQKLIDPLQTELSTTGADAGLSTASSNSDSPAAAAAAASRLPQLHDASHPEWKLLKRLAAAVLSSGLSSQEVREAYAAAFQNVPPPRGFPAWQAKLPPSPEAAAAAAEAVLQQGQHKGAQYITLNDLEDDSISNNTAADFLKLRPQGPTVHDEAAIAASAAAATAFLAQTASAAAAGERGNQPPQMRHAQGRDAAQHLLRHALLLLKASHKLAPCATDDASLPIDKLMGGPGAPRVLLAVTVTGHSEEALPNLVLQLLQMVLQTSPGSLYISLVDNHDSSSGSARAGSSAADPTSADASSSATREAAVNLDILQLLLAPLKVPMLVVHGSEIHHHSHQLLSEQRVSARNTAIEPFFTGANAQRCTKAAQPQTAGSSSLQAAAQQASSSTAGLRSGDDGNGRDTTAGSSQPPTAAAWMGAAQSVHEFSAAAAMQMPSSLGTGSSKDSSGDVGWLSSLLGREAAAGRQVLSRGSFSVAAVLGAGQEEPSAAATTASAADTTRTQAAPAAAGASAAEQSTTDSSAWSEQHSASPQQADVPMYRAGHVALPPECFNPDWVVFVDATSLFCKSDIQRLLMHTDADMACGMDLHVAEPSPEPHPPQPAAQKAEAMQSSVSSQSSQSALATVATIRRQILLQQQQQTQPPGPQLLQPPPLQQQQAGHEWQGGQHARVMHQRMHRSVLQDEHQAAVSLNGPAGHTQAAAVQPLYERPPALDIWKHPVVFASASVSRLVNGRVFNAAPYYAVDHAPTLRRLAAGLPVQVQCCWGGLTKLAAEPFKRGLRFRVHAMHSECQAAAENLMCDDLHRTGFNRLLMDAGVLLTRDLDVSVKLTPLVRAADRAPFIRRSRWVEVQGSGSAWLLDDESMRQALRSVQCCQDLSESHTKWWFHKKQRQQLLIVDEMVQAAAAGGRLGGPLPLRGWDAVECKPANLLAGNHTATFIKSLRAESFQM